MKTLTLLLPLAVILGGCSLLPSGPAGPGLDGRAFLSVAVTDGGVARPLAPGTRIRLEFSDGRVGASAGCNIMGGDYRIEGDRLRIDGGAMTEMACDPERDAQDGWLFSFLGSGPTFTLSGDDLVLASGGTTIRLLDREVAEPDLALVGPTWVVESILSGDSVSSVPADVRATLGFTADGRVLVETGCNSGGGSVAIDATTLRIADLALTKRACAGAAGQTEAAVVAVLRAELVSYQIDADLLTLVGGSSGLQLRGG